MAEVTLDKAVGLQERLAEEAGYLEEAVGRCPLSLRPVVEQMVAERRKLYDAITESIKAVAVALPEEAAKYTAEESPAEEKPIEEAPVAVPIGKG